MPAKIIAVKSLKVVKVKKKGLLNIRFQKFLHVKIFFDMSFHISEKLLDT